MSSDARIKRPTLERTQPIRQWSTLFEAAGSSASPSDPAPGAEPRREGGSALGDVVSRSVDLGYRVVDEYLRRGQAAAKRVGERSYDVQAATSDFQDLAMRTAQYASEFAAVWFDLVQRAAANSGLLRSQPGAPDGTASDPGAARAEAPRESAAAAVDTARARVKIEVASTQPAEVTLDLRAEAMCRQLIVHALRAVDPEKPRLTEVGVRGGADGQPPSVWIRVPAGQPAGVYSGVIVDAQSSRPVGTLSVRVAPAS